MLPLHRTEFADAGRCMWGGNDAMVVLQVFNGDDPILRQKVYPLYKHFRRY